MKGVTREGMDYEFTLVLEIDITNNAVATKDRTSVFKGKPSFIITPETGKTILKWCNTGKEALPSEQKELPQRIKECKTKEELLKLYYSDPPVEENIINAFTRRKAELEQKPQTPILNNNLNQNSNGT